ncbi:MAG TPA: hypothetical protein VFC46_15635, partial [Humisphaera sp.]|nr:hypothetical protein [Humisphaera sp.]
MVRSTSPSALFRVVLLVLAGCASIVQATPPVLLSAVSRMSHGATAGSFDVQLPLSGGSGIECRNVGAGMSIVMTFDQTVTGGTASVSAGATYAPGTAVISGSTITVPLSGVGDAQTFTVTVTNVKNAGNETLAAAAVPIRTLFGNAKGSGAVTGSDVNTVRAAVAAGAAINGATFRCDFNKTGVLTGSDVNIVRALAAAGATIAGGPTNDTAPTISAVADQTAVSGQASIPVGFTVGDAESNPSMIGIIIASSDQINLPIASLAISGSGTSRTLTITAPSGITATALVSVTLTASDGILTSTPITFNVNVVPPPTVYLATLQPISGVASLGSGSATLVLSGDLTSATLTYSYSNLSGSDSDDAIYAPGDNVLFDISAAHSALQANGSYLWTFKTTVTNSIAFDIQTIQSNLAY